MTEQNADPERQLKIFGQRLAEVRRSRGISQEQLALASGVARSYLSGVERGRRNISLLNINRLASALEVHPATLLESAEEKR